MPNHIGRRLMTAASFAAVAALAGAGMAAASTTITPAGETVTATSNLLTIATDTDNTLTCYSTSGDGSVPDVPGNHNPNPGGIDIDIDDVSLDNCLLDDAAQANVTTSGTWQLNANGDNYDAATGEGSEGALFIPANGAVVTAPNCTIEVTQDSTVGTLPYDNATSSVTANNTGTIWYESTGGATYCPPATNGTPAPATLSGELSFSDGVQVTD